MSTNCTNCHNCAGCGFKPSKKRGNYSLICSLLLLIVIIFLIIYEYQNLIVKLIMMAIAFINTLLAFNERKYYPRKVNKYAIYINSLLIIAYFVLILI